MKPIDFKKVCVVCHTKAEIPDKVTRLKGNAAIAHPIFTPTRHETPIVTTSPGVEAEPGVKTKVGALEKYALAAIVLLVIAGAAIFLRKKT